MHKIKYLNFTLFAFRKLEVWLGHWVGWESIRGVVGGKGMFCPAWADMNPGLPSMNPALPYLTWTHFYRLPQGWRRKSGKSWICHPHNNKIWQGLPSMCCAASGGCCKWALTCPLWGPVQSFSCTCHIHLNAMIQSARQKGAMATLFMWVWCGRGNYYIDVMSHWNNLETPCYIYH